MTGFLLLIALLSFSLSSLSSSFPNGFMFGVSTAAYQIEGSVNNRLANIWDVFTHMPNKIANNDNGDITDNSYNLYTEDIQLLNKLNISYYRMSIAWSRIINSDGSVNKEGILHYTQLFQALQINQITPLVTLYHWDMPLIYSEMQKTDPKYNGWLTDAAIPRFIEYCDIAFSTFGSYVNHWITLNEPLTVCVHGYADGTFAPGRCSNRTNCAEGNDATEPYLCAHNMLKAHSQVVNLYRTKYANNGIIGIALNSDWVVPYTNSQEDIDAAQRDLLFSLGWYTDPIFFGDYPEVMKNLVGDRLPTFTDAEKALLKGSYDFLGLNHYSSHYSFAKNSTGAPPSYSNDQQLSSTYISASGVPIGAQAASPWLFVYPDGFRALLKWISTRYSNPPIIITENGVDCPGEDKLNYPEVLNDSFRINYLQGYTSSLLDAIQYDHANIRGYFVWSIIDNFEWASGFTMKFGMCYVDFKTEARYPKDSALWYSKLINNHN